jgi:hypothetical protein
MQYYRDVAAFCVMLLRVVPCVLHRVVGCDATSRWRSWLRHCATNRNVAVSVPDGVTGIFLPTQCIYVFCVDLRTNSDYFTVQH